MSLKKRVAWNKGIKLPHLQGQNASNYRHGFGGRKEGKKDKFYQTWINIHSRCINPRVPNFHRYGGRGIKCQWKDFQEFRIDMHQSYEAHNLSNGKQNTFIERINNDGNYCKENCRWATRREQNRNRSNNRIVTFKGESLPLVSWAERLNINETTLLYRFIRGWSTEQALTTPVDKRFRFC